MFLDISVILPDGWTLTQETNTQCLDNNHPKRSILPLVHRNVLFLCIFSHFHTYGMENIPFEKGGNLPCFYIDFLDIFFFTVRSLITRWCGKSGVHVLAI